MPKRVLDFDAMWASDKLAACAPWAQAEYAWFYGLADASGSFEMTNLRVIWGRVAAIRSNLTIERLEQIFDEFMARGLLFTWEESGKRYGHWTGSDVPGRLPPPSWRARLEKLAPPVPQKQLAAYVGRFSRGTKPAAAAHAAEREHGGAMPNATVGEGLNAAVGRSSNAAPLKRSLEPPQAQGLDLDWNQSRELELNSAASAAASQSIATLDVRERSEKKPQTNLFCSAEKTAEQAAEAPSSARISAPPPNYAYRSARDLEVAKAIYVGAGPVLGPHSTARVKPEALERARRTEEAAAAARNARRARPG